MKPRFSGDASRALLSAMAHALEPGGPFRTALHVDAGVGIGRVGLEFLGSGAEIAWNRTGTRCLVMEGELFDTGALEAMVARDGGGPVRTHADLLVRLYDLEGAAGCARLNGAFVAATWDRARRELSLFNDRLGLHPLYYSRTGQAVVFASGVRALLADEAVDRRVDRVAINQFLVFDHVLDRRTLLESVSLFPQASVMTVRDDHFGIEPYWTLRYPRVYNPRPEVEYVEEFAQHLRTALTRQQPHGRRAAVLLSGGLDSRLLLGPLAELGAPLETLTFGIPGCDDAKVAQEVARHLRVPHRFFELKKDWLCEMAAEAIRATDGLGNIVNLHVIATREEQSRHADLLYKGFMGDALLGFALKRQMWADYEGPERYDVHLGVHASQGVINYTPAEQVDLLTDRFRADVGDCVYREYREGMDRAGTPQLANQRLYFDLTQRVPRMTINGVEVARTRAAVRLPFCDNDLVDFVLTIPPGFLFERYLPKRALVQYYPRLARIPIAGTGRPLASCARDIMAQTRELLAWHLRKRGLRALAGSGPRPYKDYNRWFRTTLRPWVEQILLAPRTLERGYFRPESLRRLVSEHMAGSNHAVRLGALLTVELWHRQFLD